MTTIVAELAVYGDSLDPVQVTKTLGVMPTKTWLRGDIKNRRTNAAYDYGCWKVSTAEEDSSLEEHVRILMDRFSGCTDLVYSLTHKCGYDIEVSVIVRLGEESPDLSLSKEVLGWMCGIGASLDIDTYL